MNRDISYSIQAQTIEAINTEPCIRAMHPKPRPTEIVEIKKRLDAAVATLRELALKQRRGEI